MDLTTYNALTNAMQLLNNPDVRYIISNDLGEQALLHRTLGLLREAIAKETKGPTNAS